MDKYIKKFIRRGVFYGIPLGVLIGQLIFAIMFFISGENAIEITKEQFFTQLLSSSLTGFYCTGVSVIFSIEEWSLLKRTIVNLALTTVIYFPVSYYAGWMPANLMGAIYFILTYAIVYIVIWNVFKYRIRYINKQLNDINK